MDPRKYPVGPQGAVSTRFATPNLIVKFQFRIIVNITCNVRIYEGTYLKNIVFLSVSRSIVVLCDMMN